MLTPPNSLHWRLLKGLKEWECFLNPAREITNQSSWSVLIPALKVWREMLWFHMHFFRSNIKAPYPWAHSSSTCCSSPELAQFFVHLQGLENSLVLPGISSKGEGTEQSHSWKGPFMNRQLTQMKWDPWDPVLSNFLINFPLNLCYYQDQERVFPAELHW